MHIHTAHPIPPCASPFASTRPGSPSQHTLPPSARLLPAAHVLTICRPRARYPALPPPLPAGSLSAPHALAIRHPHAHYPPPTLSLPTTLPTCSLPAAPAPAPAGAHNTRSVPIRAHYPPPTRSLPAALPSPVPTIPAPYALDSRRPCARWPPPVRLVPAPCALVAGRSMLDLPLPPPPPGLSIPAPCVPDGHRLYARCLPLPCSIPVSCALAWSLPYARLTASARVLVACRPPYVRIRDSNVHTLVNALSLEEYCTVILYVKKRS
ncbi:hypothetical protein B0H14DRAFT_3474481 [Mycena olivaceomarginata]|nr:hypothetical protein B0H14DRAFT_3474481 [Mycena olivaceomarginata]